METQEHDNQDQEEGQADGPDQIPLDGTGIGNAALRIAVYQDVGVRMLGLKFHLELVHHTDQTGAGTGVGGREGRGEEGQGHGLVRAEEVAVVDSDSAHAGGLAQDFAQEVPQAQRIHGNQLRVFAGFIGHHYLIVSGHLLLEGFLLQFLLDEAVPGSVDERRKMAEAEVHGFQRRINVQSCEYALEIVRGAVPLLQRGAVFLYQRTQFFGCQGIESILGGNLYKDLVNKADIAESELVGSGRAGKELDDVFLVLELGTKPGKNGRGSNQNGIKQSLVPLKKVVYGQKYSVHIWVLGFIIQIYAYSP